MTQRIMKRAIEICPELVKPGQGVEGLDVIKTYAGLRPLRVGGVRLEKEIIDGVAVVHNYGAGGFGCKFCPVMSCLPRNSSDRSLFQIKPATGLPRTLPNSSTRPHVPGQSYKSGLVWLQRACGYSEFESFELKRSV
jgi:hypothetical protein